jgi:hypothetical protein
MLNVSKKVQQIFIFVFIFSVFSLTLQSSVINICKDAKILKQSQQNPITEEEEESHDGDETADEEVLYLGHYDVALVAIEQSKQYWQNFNVHYPSNSGKILIPPPEAIN